MPFADHNAILDPTCSDLTARTPRAVWLHRFRSLDRSVRRGAALSDQRRRRTTAPGTGRWGVNYIYGTWQVLRGLRAIGQEHDRGLDSARSRLARELPERRRRLGRNVRILRRSRPSKAKATSTASQTAWAIMGICACGDLDRPSVQRGSALSPLDTATPMAPGTNRKSPAPVSPACST